MVSNVLHFSSNPSGCLRSLHDLIEHGDTHVLFLLIGIRYYVLCFARYQEISSWWRHDMLTFFRLLLWGTTQQTIEQTVKSRVIWEAMTSMWPHCNVSFWYIYIYLFIHCTGIVYNTLLNKCRVEKISHYSTPGIDYQLTQKTPIPDLSHPRTTRGLCIGST